MKSLPSLSQIMSSTNKLPYGFSTRMVNPETKYNANSGPVQPLRIGLISDFNVQNLVALLQKDGGQSGVNVTLAPFGQAMSLLLDAKADFWSVPHDAIIIWTEPDRAAPEFNRVLFFEEFSLDLLLDEVDSFAALVNTIPETIRTVIVPSWIAPQAERGWGPLELTNQVGITNSLMRMNLRLADAFKGNRRVVMLDAQRWLTAAGTGGFSPKLWYLSKTPFHQTVFKEASADMLAVFSGVQGRSKKVLILDLDDTLWGGIVGEVGWEKVRLGGHDPIGEAFVDFQRSLKRLVNRGVLLAIASKNEETVALEAIRRHPEMFLKLEDFAAWKINWRDKAENIAELMLELNLGLDSAVFLDDSAFERGSIREMLPQVFVPDMPADPIQYPSFLGKLRCFDTPFVSREDRTRTTLYREDRLRTSLRTDAQSLGEWLERLELRVEAELLTDGNLERAAQLFNKTNQMNLSTRRLTASELLAWSYAEGHRLWTFRVTDKFGDYGLCGIASLVHEGFRVRLLDFLLSCRVLGRGVEETMICAVAHHARSLGCEELYAEFVPSLKNQPCEKWFQNQPNFQRHENVFQLSLLDAMGCPRHVSASFGCDQ